MVVTHNLQAANASRMLGITGGKVAKSSEKLASGYKINRAADDAAGLAISEKMRSQIRGLRRASTNALDGISLIQTAEGALNEVHSMLHRMNELATQAANDTNTHTDRTQIQKEIDQIKSEIDDISQRTTFNTMPILGGLNKYKDDGSVDTSLPGEPGKLTYHTAKATIGTNISYAVYNDADGVVDVGLSTTPPFTADQFWVQDPKRDLAKAANTLVDYMGITYNGKNMQMMKLSSVDGSGNIYTNDELIQILREDVDPDFADEFVADLSEAFDRLEKDFPGDIKDMSITTKNGRRTLEIRAWSDVNEPAKYMLQVGALSGQGIEISIDHMNARRLGITGCRVGDFESAGHAMKSVQDAIDIVSGVRASLGAMQNRLEHTVANLDNTAENISASESRIRDTDMAKEMVEYTKNKLLEQVGQTILAQANTSTQGVLSLLG